MNFKEKLQDLRDDKIAALIGIESIEDETKKEIREATKKIELKSEQQKEKYNQKFTKSVNEIHDYCRLIEEYSTFNRRDIAYILADLVSVFEGKQYIISQMSYHPEKGSPAQVQDILVIIEEKNLEKINAINHISERYYYHLIKTNKIILLDGKFSLCMPETLKFYKFETGTINQNINFRGYKYLNEFINMIINYRLENNKSEITEEELENLKDQFIIKNQEKIINNLNLNAEIDMIKHKKEVEKNLEHSKKLLKRRINKIENN